MSGYASAMPADERRRIVVGQVDSGFTLEEVAQFFGITRERVRQVYTKATGQGVPVRGRTVRDARACQVRRFWIGFLVDDASGCWVWTRKRFPTGYGCAGFEGQQYTHRIAFTMVKGAIPKGLTIDHLCRNRACGNPAHLEAVTSRENTLRSPITRAGINARKTHCVRGHQFTPENTYRVGKERRCRACIKARSRRRYLDQKEVRRAA